MRGVMLSVGVCLIFLTSSALGAIVYSGSQNVTLPSSPMVSPMSMRATIDIAGQSSEWDDFTIVLSPPTGTMGMMATMGTGSRLVIYAPGSMAVAGMSAGVGGIVGLGNVASNLAAGTAIGSGSSLVDDGWALLAGSGEFDEDGGYIGLMMDNPLGSRHYGWLHMLSQSEIGTKIHTVTFDAWAYETEPNEPIYAGDVGAVPVPGAICLVLLGVGVLGIIRTRRGLGA